MTFDRQKNHAEWYQRNKETEKFKALNRQREISSTIKAYKIARGCSLCGYNKSSRSLQFHHIKGKDGNIGRMVGSGRSLSGIFEEIEKCILVCANCHGEIHEIEFENSGVD